MATPWEWLKSPAQSDWLWTAVNRELRRSTGAPFWPLENAATMRAFVQTAARTGAAPRVADAQTIENMLNAALRAAVRTLAWECQSRQALAPHKPHAISQRTLQLQDELGPQDRCGGQRHAYYS